MARIFRNGRPMTPKVNGHLFQEVAPGIFAADVPDGQEGVFFPDAQGSPYTLTDLTAPADAQQAPPPSAPVVPPVPPVAPVAPVPPTPPVPPVPPADLQVPPPAAGDAPEGSHEEHAPDGAGEKKDGDAEAGDGPDAPPPGEDPRMAEFHAAPNKIALAGLAAQRLSLSLDPASMKRDVMLDAIRGALALVPPAPPAQ